MMSAALYSPLQHSTPSLNRAYTAPINGGALSGNNGATGPGGGSSGRGRGRPPTADMAPTTNSLAHSQAHTSSSYSMQSHPSSGASPRTSDTTQGTSHSTLFSPPPLPSDTPSGPVLATDNIMNSVATQNSSLFQICRTLIQRLEAVPSFAVILRDEEADCDEDTDPVTLLWRTFRRGYPLLNLYNALQPAQPIELGAGVRENQRGKASCFKFLQACVNELRFPAEETFIVTDLYGDDTTGFVKVARVVNRVLDLLVSRGLIENTLANQTDIDSPQQLGLKKSQRQHIVSELVTTERTYVQHLELLQAFKHLVEEKGVIPGDAVHDIFLNLNSLLDFQRRFLIRVEQTNAQAESEQNWGKLFVLYEEAFRVYEPYIANQRKCERVVVAEFSKLAGAGGRDELRQIVESPTSLYGFLMKPFQRLSKYPLLLSDLHSKGDLDEARKLDLEKGVLAARGVLTRTNVAVDRQEKAEAVLELKGRVEDWKGHRVEGFGELVLFGTFVVVKSEGGGSGGMGMGMGKGEGERLYHVYLFSTILLCCKDFDVSKPKYNQRAKSLVDKRGKPKLQLKGRIFMQNVTDLVIASKPGKSSTTFTLNVKSSSEIYWKGDPSIENFVIRFPTEDGMRKWYAQIQVQRQKYLGRDSSHSHSGSVNGKRSSTSATEFEYMRGQPVFPNPYADADEDDSEEPTPPRSIEGGYGADIGSASRNASSTSLRSKGLVSADMSNGRQPAPRFAQGQFPALTLRTQQLQAQRAGSPGPNGLPGGESYFSPTGSESPILSSRTSADSMGAIMTPATSITSAGGSGTYPFPRQDDHPAAIPNGARYTAPAIGRPNASVGQRGQAPHAQQTRMHSQQPVSSALAPRLRAASSPDIQHHNNQQHNAGRPRPPVPHLPEGYSVGPTAVLRSQSNSPSLQQQMQQQQQQQRGVSPSPSLLRSGYAPRPSFSSGIGADGISPTSGGVYRGPTNAFAAAAAAPPPPTPPPTQPLPPTQLKVKVHCPSASQMLTLVVPLNISYQSLKDRIDAKLQRSTNLSLGERKSAEIGGMGAGGKVKLKYLDEEDFVSIQSDEDVATAFESWRESGGGGEGEGGMGMGEIELYCQR